MELADGTPVLDEQSGPLPSQRSRGLGLIFQHSDESLSEFPTSSTAEEPDQPSSPLGDGSPSASEFSSDEPEWTTDGPTSSPASSADAGPNPLSKKALKATFRQGVLIGSGVAHRVAARTEGQQAVALYIADEEDAANIGDPLAEIAARRDGITSKVSPDTAAFIQSMMGVAGYLSKQIVRVEQARAYDAEKAGHAPVDGPRDV